MYQLLEARMHGNKFKASTVLAIKLARTVYCRLKHHTVFEPERLAATLANENQAGVPVRWFAKRKIKTLRA